MPSVSGASFDYRKRFVNLHFTEFSHFWLRLILEESIVKLLIIDINLSHLRLYTLSSLLLERLTFFLLLDRISLSCDTGIGDETWKGAK